MNDFTQNIYFTCQSQKLLQRKKWIKKKIIFYYYFSEWFYAQYLIHQNWKKILQRKKN